MAPGTDSGPQTTAPVAALSATSSLPALPDTVRNTRPPAISGVPAEPSSCAVQAGDVGSAVAATTLRKRIAPLCCGLIWYAVASAEGVPSVNVRAELVPALAPLLTTVMATVPMPAMSAALSCALICVVETKVVVRGLPLNCTVDDAVKPVPNTVWA